MAGNKGNRDSRTKRVGSNPAFKTPGQFKQKADKPYQPPSKPPKKPKP